MFRPIFRRRAVAAAAAILIVESWLALSPARADGEDALLQRLIDDTASVSAKSAVAPAQATRSTPRDAMKLTPDRTEVIRLESDAASVIVTNPAHAQVMLETPRLMLVMPRAPGTTSVFALDAEGEVILQRDIIVSATAKPYIRIRKACSSDDAACASNSYYYCPDGCYEVTTVPATDQAQVPEVAGAPANIDNGVPAQQPVPPNAQDRTEPAPLPVMDDATGLDTESELDGETTEP